MGRPRKRQCLTSTIRNDPSVPLENGKSPFLEASDDMIDLIFKILSVGLKRKMRLEVVCKKFKSRSRSSWSGENELVLGKYDDTHISINEYKFSFQKAPFALAKLLDRITVETFIVKEMSEVPLKISMAFCQIIMEHKDFVNLKFIQFDDGSFDFSPMIAALTSCGLKNVVDLECGYWDNHRYVDSLPTSFLSLLSDCRNLKIFSLRINDISPIWEIFLQALANCHHITELYIDSTEDTPTQNVTEFAQLCSLNFPKLRILRFYLCDLPEYEPLEFINTLDEQSRLNIIDLSTSLNPEIASHREYLATICNFFPKLTVLTILCTGAGRFSSETVLQVVGNIFANYGGHEDVYKFSIDVNAENRSDVFTKLARKKWNDNDELVKIEVTNDIWKCLKNNVEITLGIRDEED